MESGPPRRVPASLEHALLLCDRAAAREDCKKIVKAARKTVVVIHNFFSGALDYLWSVLCCFLECALFEKKFPDEES